MAPWGTFCTLRRDRTGHLRRCPRGVLPVVLTRPEVREVLAHLRGTAWLMAMLLHGAGLRVLECARLRVKDIDLAANQIVVRGGKRDKDRITMLPSAVRAPLQEHIIRVRRQH